MRRFILLLALLASVLAPLTAVHALAPDEVLADPVLEQRARALSSELRCMVCQNQSIDDSDAPLAKDLRVLVRERLVAGDSDAQVIDYLVSRYGEFVLLKPKVAWHTLALWIAGPLALIAGIAGLLLALRRQRKAQPVAAGGLSAAEQAELDQILKGGTGDKS
ncbi:cytochrome c-type biogenesis protein CcmH [Pannonibacter sp. SL95]|nr:cytochrome c-type biogenesis protein [Pannonibacter sp. SL95]MCY1708624.1 cytochrome c-type biogenesis protein CcmH [Pannonibacter sp. SL95]